MLSLVDQWALAVALVFGAALFDSIDGRVARRLNVASEFGKTARLAGRPGLLRRGPRPSSPTSSTSPTSAGAGTYWPTVFPICGALRLARFNISGIRGHFVGLPITVAGPALAAFAYLGPLLPDTAEAIILLVLSALMVSTVKVPKL